MSESLAIRFLSGGHVPECRTWIESRRFAYRSINWVRQGRILWKSLDGQTRWLTAPLLFWTWPGPTFTYGAASGESWDQSWVSFKGGAADRLVRRLKIPMQANLNFCRPLEPEYVSQTFDRLLDALAQPVRPVDRMMNLLESLWLTIREAERLSSNTPCFSDRRSVHAKQQESLGHRLAKLAQSIQADPGRDWNWPRQAERWCVSLIHFRRTFQRQMGLPPQQYLIHCRMRAATEMLAATDMPVKAIAMTVGYGDVIHFTKTFRRHQGLTPTAYRREVQHYQDHG